MNYKLIIVFFCVLNFSCSDSLLIDQIVSQSSSEDELELSKKINIFSNSMQLSIPVGWEVTVSNDSLITVDNRALYEVEEYQIFTLTKNRLNSNTKELNNHNMQIIMREIVQVELCCEIYEYGSLNSTTSYCISEDLEQKELIGSNIFVSYFLYDPKDPNSFFYFLSHTYGDEKINNQQILYRIFKSIIHKSVENIHLYSETILTKDSLLYYYPTMTNDHEGEVGPYVILKTYDGCPMLMVWVFMMPNR